MTATRSRSYGRTPKDQEARERLRAAQRREAQALTRVCAAEQKAMQVQALARDAEHDVAAAHAALVEVSGLARAAVLLGTTVSGLRRGLANVSERDAKVGTS